MPRLAGRNARATHEHPDWLASFMSNPHLNTAIGAVAYAPFGESYNKSSAMRLNFTDQFQDSQIPDAYDFEARKLSDIEGRWLSPDPAGLAAVDLTNPQTWNRYAYVGNTPMSATDPLGMFIAVCKPVRGGDLVCLDGAGDRTGGMGFENPILVGGGGGLGFGINFGGLGGPLGCDSDFLPCGFPVPPLLQTLGDLLGMHPPENCEFGPCGHDDQSFPGAMGITKDDYCGFWHCDDGDIAENCMIHASAAGVGIDDLDFYTFDMIWDKLKDLATGPGAKYVVAKRFGKVAAARSVRALSGVYQAYFLWQGLRAGYKKMGECIDKSGYGKPVSH